MDTPTQPPTATDFGVAAVVLALTAAGTVAVGHGDGPDVVGWILLAVMGGTLAWRRRWPLAVLVTVVSAALVFTLTGNPGGFYTLPMGIALFTLAAERHRRTALAGLAGSFLAFLGADLLFEVGHAIASDSALWFLGWLTVAYLLGEVARSRSDYVRAVEERAVEAERSRHADDLRLAGEERMEIARELHDVLAHSISIINVQAGAALHHFDTDTRAARDALVTVRDTGKRALNELRSSISVLRMGGSEVPIRPAPRLSDIDHLAEQTRLAGLAVDVTVDVPGEVPGQVAQAAYRIVQESLTNVVRHAAASRAEVSVKRHRDTLAVRVADDGRGASPEAGAGHGISGMRERSRALGGTLTTGPSLLGGFQVEAELPVKGIA